jgi:hypothetical protein
MQTMAQVQAESLDETVKGYVIGQQFLNDYTLVIDNDQDAYTEAIDTVNSLGTGNVIYISNSFQTQFEDYISQVAEREEELGNTTGALLIKQLLLGYGSSTFDLIARHYIETAKDAE